MPFSWIYGIVTDIRNRFYDCGILSSKTFSIPIICVGNINVGGTGKTPHTEYLIRLLSPTHKIAVLSRGYKRKTTGFITASATSTAQEIGDEPQQMHTKFPEITVAVDADRCEGVSNLLSSGQSHTQSPSCIILDDAFQHRHIRAGLNIVLLDYNRPFFHDHLLPAGRLRESSRGLRRADIIIVTKCPSDLSQAQIDDYSAHIRLDGRQKLFFSTYRYTALPANQKLLLVTGIANPLPLEEKLISEGNEVITLRFNDHHSYTNNDISLIKSKAIGRTIITTEKDAVKLNNLLDFTIAEIQVEILNNQQEEFNKIIIEYANQRIS